jgi:2-dehydropantoate 2-reductase
MRTLVVGAGSTGGYFGGRLSQAGRDITFLVRPSRAEVLRISGLRIRSPHGNITLTPQIITAGEIRSSFDLIFLSVKAWSLVEAMEDFAPAVGDHSMILPVLNGMRHMEDLSKRFGVNAIIGGVCKVAAVVDEEGGIIQLSPLQSLAYGEINGVITPRLMKLDESMQGCGFDAKLSTEISREMWEKWALLATIGGATCLMRGNLGQIAAAPSGTEFISRLFDEVVQTIKRIGIAPSEEFIGTTRAILTRKDSQMTSSMYRDLTRGNRIERDQIIQDLIERGKEFGLTMPLLTLVATNLTVYEKTL